MAILLYATDAKCPRLWMMWNTNPRRAIDPFPSSLIAHDSLCSCTRAELKEMEVTAFVDDEAEEDQKVEVSIVERRPEVQNVYFDFMDFNDTANALDLSSTVQARKYHWTSAYMYWVQAMLLCVNSRKCYQSATGETLTVQ